MDIRDEHCLNIVKNRYGGSIKLRSGAKAVRYRLHHKEGQLKLINDVNGKIRNPLRIYQFHKICKNKGVLVQELIPNTKKNGWYAGFIDGDGTITINSNNYQLAISASNKYPEILDSFKTYFSGNIYPDRGKHPSFKWYLTKKEDILLILDYFKEYPLHSAKKKRIFMIPEYYKLKSLKAHLEPENSNLGKSWKYFINKWNSYDG